MADIDLAELLQQAVAKLNADEIGAAENLLQQIADSGHQIPQATTLMGVVRSRQKRYDEAEALFGEVLKAQPGQPTTLYYLAIAQREKGAAEAAARNYRKVLAARPDFTDAALGLAASLRALGEAEAAKEIYQRVLAVASQSVEAMAGLGAACNDLGQYDEAEALLYRAQKLPAPKDLIAEIEDQLGFAKMSQRRFADALPHFERALFLVPGHPAAEKNRARVLDYLNRPERAASAYRRVLANDPLDLKTHLLLDELLHRSGRPSDMLRSYDEAARAKPASPVPPTAKGDQLLLLDRPAEAADSFGRALRLRPDHVAAHIGLGRALAALGDHDSAIRAFEGAQKACPENPDLDTAFAFALLRQKDDARALTFAERANAKAPHHQPALAVLGLCYRARNDSREDVLCDYERFVRIFDLEPPKGFGDIASFHDALRAHLEPLHGQTKEFFSQTLRGGTRTVEDIFAFHHPLREGLKQRIMDVVGRYIAGMPESTTHPFLARREGAFRFLGSWSSRMTGGGFHVNHIHNGWISSAYYVDVPEASGDTESHQGWLKFGEPSADLGLDNPIRRMVQPKPGRLVLFPSYLWHGTVPFHSGETRMTIAFDAVPVPKS